MDGFDIVFATVDTSPSEESVSQHRKKTLFCFLKTATLVTVSNLSSDRFYPCCFSGAILLTASR